MKDDLSIVPLRWAKKEYTDENLFISHEEISIDTLWTAVTPYHIYEIYESESPQKALVLLNDMEAYEEYDSVWHAKEAVQHEYERIVAEIWRDCIL